MLGKERILVACAVLGVKGPLPCDFAVKSPQKQNQNQNKFYLRNTKNILGILGLKPWQASGNIDHDGTNPDLFFNFLMHKPRGKKMTATPPVVLIIEASESNESKISSDPQLMCRVTQGVCVQDELQASHSRTKAQPHSPPQIKANGKKKRKKINEKGRKGKRWKKNEKR